MIHHIQRTILDRLATAESRRYGELKPAELDGNVFTYHLKQLIANRYVVKRDDGSYALTASGRDYIVHRFEDPLLQAHTVFLIAVRRGDDWLMRTRLVQPLLGTTGFIHGEPIASEPLLETARQRLTDKTGFSLDVMLFSSGLIRIMRGDTIESFSHALILTAETDQDITITHDATGRQSWRSLDTLRHPDIIPSCVDIIERIVANDRSPFDLSYQLAP